MNLTLERIFAKTDTETTGIKCLPLQNSDHLS